MNRLSIITASSWRLEFTFCYHVARLLGDQVTRLLGYLVTRLLVNQVAR